MKLLSSSTILLLFLGLFLSGCTNQSTAQCVTGQVPVDITLVTDDYPQDTDFRVRDLSTGQIVFQVSQTSLAPNSTYNYSFCAVEGHCLKTELIDAASNGGPSVTIVYDGNTTFSSPDPGNFDQFETILVGTSQCTDISKVNSWDSYVVTSRGNLRVGNDNVFNAPIAGGIVSGNICMGDDNMVNGWLAGGEIGYGSGNTITGHNNLAGFGKTPAIRPCGTNQAPMINELHIQVPPIGNSTDCDISDILPVATESIEIPMGVTEVIEPGNYTHIHVAAGATALAVKGNYTAQEIIIEGGRLMPGGGGVLCDIFFRASYVEIQDGSTVMATINCDHVVVGHGSEFEGYLHIMDDTQSSSIGNNNKFTKPACPPCEEALNKKEGKGHGFVPMDHTPEDFEIVPHPVSGEQFGISATGLAYPAKLNIYNLSGDLVNQMDIQTEDDLNNLDRGRLASGMYICKLDSLDGKIRTTKLMVQ